jgi:uncharacterized protein YcgI (DUF1989 family)
MIVTSQLAAETASYREVVAAGDFWIESLKTGQTLRILDLEGNQAADTLFYNLEDPHERYSAMDTILAGVTTLWVGPARQSRTRSAMRWKKSACMPAVTAGCWQSAAERNLV